MPDQRALVGMLAGGLSGFDVRQQVDLRIARVTVLVEHVHLQLAELPAEGDLLRLVDALRRKDEQQVPIERLLDRLALRGRERRGQVDAVHRRAHHRAERRYFHTSRTTSITSSSLRRVSSCVTVWPEPPPLEKPHCGERPSRSSGTYFAASSMRRLRASLLSSWGVLVDTRPRTT